MTTGLGRRSAEAASAALPALTMLAEDAEAKYGDNRKWHGDSERHVASRYNAPIDKVFIATIEYY